MTPRYMPEDRSITREQARPASPDTSKPLDQRPSDGDGKPGTRTPSSGAPLPADGPEVA